MTKRLLKKKNKKILSIFSYPKLSPNIINFYPKNIKYGPGIVLLGKLFDDNIVRLILRYSSILDNETKICLGYMCGDVDEYLYINNKNNYCNKCKMIFNDNNIKICKGCNFVYEDCSC